MRVEQDACGPARGNPSRCGGLRRARFDNPPAVKPHHSVLLLAMSVLVACAPALDWRDVRLADSEVVALFPCKPDRHARTVSLAQQPVRLVLYACTAGGATWALAAAEVADPAQVGPALVELRGAAMQNLSATQAAAKPLRVDGATPNVHSERIEIRGRMPDGRVVTEQLALFAKGTQVYQATALSEKLGGEAADIFFDGLRASR